MRIIMMGTGPFAVPTFESLIASEHDVIVLVTRPQPPVRSRGKPPVNPMRDAAERHGVEFIAPDDVNSDTARTQLSVLRPDLFVVCDYGQILSSDTLAIAPLGGINLHGSLLPKYRGAAPVQWCIYQGDVESGVAVIHMTPKLDGGPCLVMRATAIDPAETAGELEPRLSQMGVEPVHEAIGMLSDWDRSSTLGTLQDQSLASRAPRLKKSDGNIDWRRSAREIQNQIRAFKPWPGSFTQWQRKKGQTVRLIIEQIAVAATESEQSGAAPGTIVQADECGVRVATSDGTVVIEALQPAGKRVMTAAEFLRGQNVSVGDRFGESED